MTEKCLLINLNALGERNDELFYNIGLFVENLNKWKTIKISCLDLVRMYCPKTVRNTNCKLLNTDE